MGIYISTIILFRVDWQLVLLGRAEKEQRVRAKGRELTHQEKRKGVEEESDRGGKNLYHWHMEMQGSKRREGEVDEGRKVTRSDRERGMGGEKDEGNGGCCWFTSLTSQTIWGLSYMWACARVFESKLFFARQRSRQHRNQKPVRSIPWRNTSSL